MSRVTTILGKEILRYEREVWKDDMRDPIHPPIFRTPRALFYSQCASAWRKFALAAEMIETGQPVLWPCKRHGVVGCGPCFAIWRRFHPEGLS